MLRSVGIIMDGNRRYAKARGFSVPAGHRAGYEKLKEFVGWAKEAGVQTVYAYAFSTENWNRTKKEVGFLLKLFEYIIMRDAKVFAKEQVRVRFIGRLGDFSQRLQEGMRRLERETEQYAECTLVIALSYGGRAEIIEAMKKISRELTKKGIEQLDEAAFESYLWTQGLPDPDLIIRTSGERRTSNFLPWQSAYSEWYFTPTLWPALTKREFLDILKDFSTRERRRGV